MVCIIFVYNLYNYIQKIKKIIKYLLIGKVKVNHLIEGQTMNKEIIFFIEKDINGGYSAKATKFSIFTEGNSIKELKENIKDAIRCHFEKEEDIHGIIHLRIIREEIISYT